MLIHISNITGLKKNECEKHLEIMKEFINGINKHKEKDKFKKKYSKEEKNYEPKYKNLIIGDSYINKSTLKVLKDELFFNL